MTRAENPPAAGAARTGAWESEGGALVQREDASPPGGIIPIVVTNYRVGTYTYSNLADATAQLHRQEGAQS